MRGIEGEGGDPHEIRLRIKIYVLLILIHYLNLPFPFRKEGSHGGDTEDGEGEGRLFRDYEGLIGGVDQIGFSSGHERIFSLRSDICLYDITVAVYARVLYHTGLYKNSCFFFHYHLFFNDLS